MEKKFREYIRHLEKIDYDVISDEEIRDERDGLELRLTEIHQEMIRILIPMMAFLICACIFLAAGFNGFFIGNFVAAAVMAIGFIVTASRYNILSKVTKQLGGFIDRLNMR